MSKGVESGVKPAGGTKDCAGLKSTVCDVVGLGCCCCVGCCVSASDSSDELSELPLETLPELSSFFSVGCFALSVSSLSLSPELEDSVSSFSITGFGGTGVRLGRGTSLCLRTPLVFGLCIAMFIGVFVFVGFAFDFGAGVSLVESSLLSIVSLLNG
jgi:hypothetical protein